MKPKRNLNNSHNNYSDLFEGDASAEMEQLVGSLDKLYNREPLPTELKQFKPSSQFKRQAEKPDGTLTKFSGKEQTKMLNTQGIRLFPVLTGVIAAMLLTTTLLFFTPYGNLLLNLGSKPTPPATTIPNVVQLTPTVAPTPIIPPTLTPVVATSPTPFPTYTPLAITNPPATLPTISGLEKLDLGSLNNQVFPKEYREVPLQIYASKEAAGGVIQKLHNKLIADGYKQVNSRGEEVTQNPGGANQLYNFYVKSGSPDIMVDMGPLPTVEGAQEMLDGPGMPTAHSIPDFVQKIATLHAQGYNTIAFVRINQGLRLAMLAGERNELPVEVAEQILRDYLKALNEGNYQQAAELYGGPLDLLSQLNPDVNPTDKTKLLERACKQNGFQCLQVKTVRVKQRLSPAEYEFAVEFQTATGQTFVGTNPPTAQFSFILVSKQALGLIMNLPPRKL